MNSSYLNSVIKIILSSKPSSAIGLFLMVLFVFMKSNVSNAQGADCANATSLTINGLCDNGIINDVTQNSPDISSCSAGTFRREGWYTFTVSGGPLDVTITGVTTNRNLFLQLISSTASCTGLSQINCANNYNSNNSAQTETISTTLNNGIYYIKVVNAGTSNGNMSLTSICVTATPTISSFTPSSGCSNSTSVVITGTNFTGVTGVSFGGTNAASYVVNSSTQITAVPAAGISGSISVVTSGGTATSGSNFTVNPSPTVTTSASPTSVASGGNVTLTASVTTPTTQNTILLSEGFNGATNTWTKINNSTGGTPANAAWTLRPDGYSYAYSGYPTRVFHSNDNSQFYLSNSAAQGNATTATILQSPAMSTVGYTSLSLEFYQYNLDFDGSDYARVEVSTNGSSWTTLSTTTTTQGAENDFLQTTINLNAYINQATLYIRFKYDAQFDWFWAIDNVTISGNKTIDYTYSWSATPSGTAGLPSGAGTASTSNNSIVASPTANTAYTVTATNPVSGCTGTSVVNVSILAPTITSISSSSGCVGSTITINGTNLSGAMAANVRIGGTAVASITSNTSTQIVAVVGNGTTGVVTVTISGNTATSALSFTVNPASVGGTVSGGSTPICQGSSTGTLTLSGYTGTIVNWEKQLNGGGWNWAGGSATTFSEIPYAAGTWEYRAVVQSGSCTSAYSSIQTIVVSPTPVGGGVYSGNTPICLNSSTGNMTLGGGYVGNVVRWEKRLLPSVTWTTIANTTTVYSENPSVAGTWEYRAVVGSGSCTEVYSSAFSVTVNPELTITLINSNSSVCQNTTTASFAYSATTGSPAACVVDFDSTANTAGFSDLSYVGLGSAPNTFSVNVPWGAAAGVYNATLTLKTDWPSCTSTVSYPITVTVGIATPTVGTITQPNCSTPTGSVVLSGLPASGTIYQTGTVVTNFPITGTSMTISGLTEGTYQFSASNGTCTSSATGNVVINSLVTNTWTGAWSQGTPTADQKIVFAANYSSTGNVTACSCMVTSGAITFNANDTLTLTNELKITAGSLTFENNGSLVQINDAAINSGNIIYKRNTSSVRISDYTYWSSPVANQNLAISPAYTSGMFYSFNDFATPESWKSESASTIMTVGKGYIIRGQQIGSPTPPPPPSFYQATFTGTPHNGNKSIAIGPIGNSNLLGNPYPSAIDANKFLSANSTVIEGTIYFWTHNTAIQLASNITNGTAGSGAFAYTSDDYASYNGTGGVAVSGGIIPTGEIAAGQAFFTTSKATGGSVAFNNAMRLSSGGAILDNSQFFKTKNTKGKTAQIEKNRIWLNLTNAKGAFKQTLVGYIAGATNDIDNAFDGESFDGQEFIDFYSVNQGKNLTIQGRALPFSENDEVPLGFRSTIEGSFSISIDQVDGSMTNQKIFIEDKLTNTITELNAGNYTFSTVAGTFNDRFVLRYTNGKTLGTDTVTTQKNKVVVSVKNKQIKINSLSETINKVVIFDLLGRQIYQNNKVDSNEFLTTDFSSSHQALIVKTTLQNGELVTNKIIF
ncbi:T9SS sorting signal type C domain-containing protein [Flavobacterium alvei]|uniref:beta strand repeat-containing protein n=1 Tax=Flavobacterium alvei TaxID=2080416 RepID=UPI0026EA770C|nr:T9SS sorting signal type C domain-containing protein [Flavobacterium alvei]